MESGGKKFVVAFKGEPKEEEWECEEVSVEPPEGAQPGVEAGLLPKKVRKWILKGASWVTSKKFKSGIYREELSEFQGDDDQCTYRKYKYGLKVEKGKFPEGGSDVEERNPEVAGDIALQFVRHPKAFGHYDLGKWNCECFASFCKTTPLRPDDLKQKINELSDGEDACLKREFLKTEGVKSIQALRYVEDGVLVTKDTACQESDNGQASAVMDGKEGHFLEVEEMQEVDESDPLVTEHDQSVSNYVDAATL